MNVERSFATWRAVKLRLLLLLISTLLTILLAEIMLQLLCQSDADGNVTLLGKTIKSSSIPVQHIKDTLARYQTSTKSRMIIDALTGWKPRPDQCTHQQMYCYNSQGIRSAPQEYNLRPQTGMLRIALFGDSFTHGDDVPWVHTWAYQLEQQLRQHGIPAEVINFGVSAYGMDQAFLRWQQLGQQYQPQIVIFGFQAENINRNVNMLRGYYMARTGIPFSKPRYILEGDRLRLINSPALPLDQIVSTMQNMQSWPLAKHEWFYDPDAQSPPAWQWSRLLLLISNVFQLQQPIRQSRSVYELSAEPALVTLRLMKLFAEDVRDHDADFLIVHLPTKRDLALVQKQCALPYQKILSELELQFHMIATSQDLLSAAKAESLDALFQKQHYSQAGNKIIASQFVQRIKSIIGREK